jgi:hypothetical protein
MTHAAGHYERWKRLGSAQLVVLGYPQRISWTEYDDWPRGRIVYQKPARRFIIYADLRLQKPDVDDALKIAFGLNNAEELVMSDAHYR